MTYDEALAFWYSRVNYERTVPQLADLKLDRMRALLHRLGDPHDRLRTVHVAGSKGKGSTCAMLASVLRHAGYRTGLFTSPHLVDVRERIQIDGELIGRDEVAALMAEIRSHVEALEAEGHPPTFFEVGTALGFLHFQRCGCDIAVVEVGLGGRFDSTNVLTPLVSVITSISLDHTAILGETVEQIAFEKAGIIKPGVPVVSGVTESTVRRVIFQIADEWQAPVHESAVTSYSPGLVSPDGQIQWPSAAVGPFHLRSGSGLTLGLLGSHQAANAAVAVLCLDLLRQREMVISEQAIRDGLAHVQWPARMEVFQSRPLTVLDCAHNVASAEALLKTLAESFPHARRSLVFAASSDKDVPGMFRVLAPHFERFYLTRYQQSTQANSPEQLAAWLPPDKARVVCRMPADAWRTVCADATPDTLVVIAGSVFLAGELRPLLVEACRVDR